MKYRFIAFGLVLLLVFFAPIYYTTGYCCGHEYDEAMTIAKHFLLGQDSCLAFANDIGIGWLYLLVFVVSLWSIIHGLGDLGEVKKDA
jgi:hypothetical protein